MAGENFSELSQLWEEEGLFSRDIDGQLVRLEEVTEQDYEKKVTLQIDGQEITIRKARPTRDSQGNVVRDENGKTIPRDTTIFDAAQKLYVNNELGKENPIPTLCHREHMRPVAICRVCCVEVYKEDRERQTTVGRQAYSRLPSTRQVRHDRPHDRDPRNRKKRAIETVDQAPDRTADFRPPESERKYARSIAQ